MIEVELEGMTTGNVGRLRQHGHWTQRLATRIKVPSGVFPGDEAFARPGMLENPLIRLPFFGKNPYLLLGSSTQSRRVSKEIIPCEKAAQKHQHRGQANCESFL